jgi:Flp pilus assembly protein TadB
MTGALVVLCGLSFGCGLVGVLATWPVASPDAVGPVRIQRYLDRLRGGSLKALLVGLAGVSAGVATGWPVVVPIVWTATYGLPGLFRRTSGSVSIVKIEAIATWTEMLQGTLAASAGLSQAIVATAPLSPLPIREAANRLSARLNAGMHPREALSQFAEEVGDPCTDRVVCALQLAIASRAQRLGDLLTALADSTRDEVALRLRIETSRASVRSGVRTVVVFSVVFAGALVLLAHTYLAPFGSPKGQLVLVVVGALYAGGLFLMASMARPPAPVRLIGTEVVEA